MSCIKRDPLAFATIKTPSELKTAVEKAGHDRFFFAPKTMKFFGDTMGNYGVRAPTIIMDTMNEEVMAIELYRKQAVRHGLKNSAWFDSKTFARVFKKENT